MSYSVIMTYNLIRKLLINLLIRGLQAWNLGSVLITCVQQNFNALGENIHKPRVDNYI